MALNENTGEFDLGKFLDGIAHTFAADAAALHAEAHQAIRGHGGAFLDDHPNRAEEIYSNVLHYFSLNGIVGIKKPAATAA